MQSVRRPQWARRFERHCALFLSRKLPLILDLDLCLIHAHTLVKGHMSDETGEVARDASSNKWHCCDERNQRMYSFRWRLETDWKALRYPSTGRIKEEIEQLKEIEDLRAQIDKKAPPRYP